MQGLLGGNVDRVDRLANDQQVDDPIVTQARQTNYQYVDVPMELQTLDLVYRFCAIFVAIEKMQLGEGSKSTLKGKQTFITHIKNVHGGNINSQDNMFQLNTNIESHVDLTLPDGIRSLRSCKPNKSEKDPKWSKLVLLFE